MDPFAVRNKYHVPRHEEDMHKIISLQFKRLKVDASLESTCGHELELAFSHSYLAERSVRSTWLSKWSLSMPMPISWGAGHTDG